MILKRCWARIEFVINDSEIEKVLLDVYFKIVQNCTKINYTWFKDISKENEWMSE